jgi:hypothetical protein
MSTVLHANSGSFLLGRLRRAAAALAVAALSASQPSLAGEASSSFRITIQVVPEGTGVCSTNSANGSPQVSCRPTVVGGAPAGGGGDPKAGSTVLGYRPDNPVKVAGEMVEVGNENHFAWAENNYYALGEYSSRLMTAGGRQYVEMTVSW